jgi:hypothetical protein
VSSPEDHHVDVGTCPYDMNLFDRHMQNCFGGVLFYKVIDRGWGEE